MFLLTLIYSVTSLLFDLKTHTALHYLFIPLCTNQLILTILKLEDI